MRAAVLLALALTGCASRLDTGKALIVSEATVEASAKAATASAATLTPDQKAKAKAALDAADAAVRAAHEAYRKPQ